MQLQYCELGQLPEVFGQFADAVVRQIELLQLAQCEYPFDGADAVVTEVELPEPLHALHVFDTADEVVAQVQLLLVLGLEGRDLLQARISFAAAESLSARELLLQNAVVVAGARHPRLRGGRLPFVASPI